MGAGPAQICLNFTFVTIIEYIIFHYQIVLCNFNFNNDLDEEVTIGLRPNPRLFEACKESLWQAHYMRKK